MEATCQRSLGELPTEPELNSDRYLELRTGLCTSNQFVPYICYIKPLYFPKLDKKYVSYSEDTKISCGFGKKLLLG